MNSSRPFRFIGIFIGKMFVTGVKTASQKLLFRRNFADAYNANEKRYELFVVINSGKSMKRPPEATSDGRLFW